MLILIPMAGKGSRFLQQGYQTPKPAMPVTSRLNGVKVPMVVAAAGDLPGIRDQKNKVLFIDRALHQKMGLQNIIKAAFPNANFITIDAVTEGQASTCLLAKDYISADEELMIGGCDNGMIFSKEAFEEAKHQSDALIFTFRKHELVLENPKAHGWVKVDHNGNVLGLSVKKPISDNPMQDHAIVASFWFNKGGDFVRATNKMIAENDRINNEFYVDQVMEHMLALGHNVKVFEVEEYLCWGTPKDYEIYENTVEYWRSFFQEERME